MPLNETFVNSFYPSKYFLTMQLKRNWLYKEDLGIITIPCLLWCSMIKHSYYMFNIYLINQWLTDFEENHHSGSKTDPHQISYPYNNNIIVLLGTTVAYFTETELITQTAFISIYGFFFLKKNTNPKLLFVMQTTLQQLHTVRDLNI